MDKEITFRYMRDTLTFMLIMAINTKGMQLYREEDSERLKSIKNICGELSELCGMGYGVLPNEQEGLLEQIVQMIDTLAESELDVSVRSFLEQPTHSNIEKTS